MAFNATYTSDDAAPVVIDTALKVVVGAAAFAAVLGLVIGINLLRGRTWNGKTRTGGKMF